MEHENKALKKTLASLLSHLPTSSYPIYVGKYDHNGCADDDLSFKKGDLMYIINTDVEDWWFARSKDSGKEGYIPSNYVAEWKSLDVKE